MRTLKWLFLIVATATGLSSAGCNPRANKPDRVATSADQKKPPSPPTVAPVQQAQSPAPIEPAENKASNAPEAETADVAPGKTAETGQPSTGEPSLAAGTVPVVEGVNAGANNAMAVPTKPASWTTQRLVLMGTGGPRFIKLDVNIAGQDLEQGFQTALSKLADELAMDFAQPIDWNTLLDKPLIASGWLGNLVPGSEQRDQLRGLYDTNKNETVDEAEFRAFITRGVSRIAHMKLSSRPSNAPRFPSDSPWGPIDLDASGDLRANELGAVTATMLHYDFDGDRILTPDELRSATEALSNMPSSGSRPLMLDMTPVQAWDPAKPEAMARSILQNYSFGSAMSSELLFAWPSARIKRFDIDKDPTTIELDELKVVSDADLDGEFQVSLPAQLDSNDEKLNVNFQSIEPGRMQSWIPHPEGGRLTLGGCIVTIVVNDEQSSGVRDAFKAQFGRLEKDAQLQAFAMQALELKEGAIEVLKRTAEERHVDPGDLAWRWLVAPRHWHVQIAWSASESPWFELMDLNGDQRLVVAELEQFADQAKSWDRNKDGVLATEEMPVSILLEVKRGEARGLRSRLGGTAVEKRGTNAASAPTWFTGMDYNSDGELSQSEFLGDRSDFEKLDLDRDGIIEAREVTTPIAHEK